MPIEIRRSAAGRAREVEGYREAARAYVNETIGQRRLDYITDGPGQEMIYREKVAEAERYMVERPDKLDAYPFLAAEIGVTAPDAEALAILWLARARAWKVIGGQLEAIRQGALIAIGLATEAVEVDVAVSEFDAVYAAWAPPE